MQCNDFLVHLLGAGFESKVHYGSGFFHTMIKLPDKNSIGVVTAFYVRFYVLLLVDYLLLLAFPRQRPLFCYCCFLP